ncbi:MAG: hypothetical protein WD156_11220 [Acidimicrobiia bacterium]
MRPPEDDVTFFGLDDGMQLMSAEPDPVPVIGTVRGRVEMVTQRRGLRFTLYDLLSDRAVYCYLAPDKAEMLRFAWGHIADVTGIVKRDPNTDRPVTIRRVSSVEAVPEVSSDSYLRARGAIRPADSAQRSEDLIRSLREERRVQLLDSNTVLAFILDEEGRAATVEGLFAQAAAGRRTLVASTIIMVEVAFSGHEAKQATLDPATLCGPTRRTRTSPCHLPTSL